MTSLLLGQGVRGLRHMTVEVSFPNDFAARFGSDAEHAPCVLATLAAGEYNAGRMGKAELGEILGLEAPGAVERFLGARGVRSDDTPATTNGERYDCEAAAVELVERS